MIVKRNLGIYIYIFFFKNTILKGNFVSFLKYSLSKIECIHLRATKLHCYRESIACNHEIKEDTKNRRILDILILNIILNII